jgi:hypothetical protein
MPLAPVFLGTVHMSSAFSGLLALGGGVQARWPAIKQWWVAIRVTTVFQALGISKSFGEPMAGGGGRALVVIRLRARPLARF